MDRATKSYLRAVQNYNPQDLNDVDLPWFQPWLDMVLYPSVGLAVFYFLVVVVFSLERTY